MKTYQNGEPLGLNIVLVKKEFMRKIIELTAIRYTTNWSQERQIARNKFKISFLFWLQII